MARNTTKTYILIDANGKPAAGELQRIEDAAKDVDKELNDVADPGKWDGMKTGIGGVTDALGAAAGPLAAGAVVAALGKAVTEVVDLTVQAGTMATALDLSVEEASRLNAAFGDVGLEMNDTVDIALQIGQAVADDTELAQALGLEVGKVITPIEALEAGIDRWDFLTPTQRAQSFGEEGVRQISRLVAEGQTLDEILADVSDNRIFDQEDLDRALEFEATMADLKGSFEAATIVVAEGLLPAVNAVLGVVAEIAEVTENLPDGDAGGGFWDNVYNAAENALNPLNHAVELSEGIQEIWTGGETADAIDYTTTAMTRQGEEAAAVLGGMRDGIRNVETAYDSLTGNINKELAWIRLQEQFDKVKESSEAATDAAEQGLEDASEKAKIHEKDLLRLQLEVGKYGDEILGLPDEETTDLILNTPNLADTERRLARLTQAESKTVYIDIQERYDANRRNAPSAYDPNAPRSTSTTNITNNITMSRTANPRELTAVMDTWKRANG